jgi:hypothetical protein
VLSLIVVMAMRLHHSPCAPAQTPVALRLLSTHGAVMAGEFDGNFSVRQALSARVGFGVYSALDGEKTCRRLRRWLTGVAGELIIKDGTAYRVTETAGGPEVAMVAAFDDKYASTPARPPSRPRWPNASIAVWRSRRSCRATLRPACPSGCQLGATVRV